MMFQTYGDPLGTWWWERIRDWREIVFLGFCAFSCKMFTQGNSKLLRTNANFLGGMQNFCKLMQSFSGTHKTFANEQTFLGERKTFENEQKVFLGKRKTFTNECRVSWGNTKLLGTIAKFHNGRKDIKIPSRIFSITMSL